MVYGKIIHHNLHQIIFIKQLHGSHYNSFIDENYFVIYINISFLPVIFVLIYCHKNYVVLFMELLLAVECQMGVNTDNTSPLEGTF